LANTVTFTTIGLEFQYMV